MTAKMKPILFNTDMVRAILDDRKTVTRRVVKPQPPGDFPYCQKAHDGSCWWWNERGGDDDMMRWWPSYDNGLTPPYHPGDILYVRETWCKTDCFGLQDGYAYKANDNSILTETGFVPKWRPSIHMPREAARIFLRVTDVRVERLQDIDGRGALSEGVDNRHSNPTMGKRWENMQRMEFSTVWDSTIKPADRALYGWAANPWVWVIEFERISREEASR